MQASEVVRAVLLDSLGTLVELRPVAPRLRAELSTRGIGASEHDAARAFAAEVGYYLEHHLEGRDAASLDRLRDSCAAVTAEALGVGPERLGDVRAALLAAIAFEPIADAPATLRSLRAAGLRLVVASNWDCSLRSVLADAGLDGLVDEVVTSAEVGAAKPAPGVFFAALDAAGCGPGEAVFVGDSLERDVAGARAVGMEAILVDRSGSPPRVEEAGVTVVRSLAEAGALVLRRAGRSASAPVSPRTT